MTSNLLTTKDLLQIFGVTAMTITGWRKGLTAKAELPTITKIPGRILFNRAAVKKWAEKEGVEIRVDPITFISNEVGKPGPKPKQKLDEEETQGQGD